jgi:hypothetical protein
MVAKPLCSPFSTIATQHDRRFQTVLLEVPRSPEKCKIQDFVNYEQTNTRAAAATATPTSGTATETSIETPAVTTCYIHTSKIKNRKLKSAIAGGRISRRGLHVRVRFNVDAKDHVREEVFTYDKVPEDLKSDLFWSKKDRQACVSEAIQKSRIFSSKHSDLVERLNTFHEFCGLKRGKDITSCSNDNSCDIEIIRFWSASKVARGLEDCLTNRFGDERKASVTGLLNYQRSLLQPKQLKKRKFWFRGADNNDKTDIRELLRNYSLSLTQRSREYASKIALGDELVAKLLFID